MYISENGAKFIRNYGSQLLIVWEHSVTENILGKLDFKSNKVLKEISRIL